MSLDEIQRASVQKRLVLTRHGSQRAEERGATSADIEHAVMNATACVSDGPEKWKLEGPDTDGDPLTVVVARAEDPTRFRIVSVF